MPGVCTETLVLTAGSAQELLGDEGLRAVELQVVPDEAPLLGAALAASWYRDCLAVPA